MKALESSYLKNFSDKIFNELKLNESLTLTLSAEKTLFTRLSKAKVRQSTNLEQAYLLFNFIKENKVVNFKIPYRGDSDSDFLIARKKLEEARLWAMDLPDDPYLVRPKFYGVTKEENMQALPANHEMQKQILEAAKGLDLAGLFSSGEIAKATTNSEGQFHWFKTRNFYLDYSLYNLNQKAVKSLYAGFSWSGEELKNNIEETKKKLELMNKTSLKIAPGHYRAYLAPAAVGELLGTLSWGGVSMGAHERGNGALKDLWKGQKKFSPLFSLREDFSLGLSARFNEVGEMSPTSLTLVEKGEFKNFLTSTRTANEYKRESNFSSDGESLRSPVIAHGDLSREKIFQSLGTGLYISNLHYLNWSDRESARITGMTRYASFWVENGEVVAPIHDLRFDESYYSFFGNSLEALGNFSEVIPNTGSYFERDIGGLKTPGILLSKFHFTI